MRRQLRETRRGLEMAIESLRHIRLDEDATQKSPPIYGWQDYNRALDDAKEYIGNLAAMCRSLESYRASDHDEDE